MATNNTQEKKEQAKEEVKIEGSITKKRG